MSNQVKTWRVTGAKAGMQVTSEGAFMVGSEKNFIAATDKGISLIAKSIAFGTTSENLRHAGLWVEMNDFLRMIPQSIVTPIPSQIPWPPLGFATSIVRDVPFFIAMAVGSVAATAMAVGGAVA